MWATHERKTQSDAILSLATSHHWGAVESWFSRSSVVLRLPSPKIIKNQSKPQKCQHMDRRPFFRVFNRKGYQTWSSAWTFPNVIDNVSLLSPCFVIIQFDYCRLLLCPKSKNLTLGICQFTWNQQRVGCCGGPVFAILFAVFVYYLAFFIFFLFLLLSY